MASFILVFETYLGEDFPVLKDDLLFLSRNFNIKTLLEQNRIPTQHEFCLRHLIGKRDKLMDQKWSVYTMLLGHNRYDRVGNACFFPLLCGLPPMRCASHRTSVHKGKSLSGAIKIAI
ncbi:hypothetical protein Tco_0969576 [Tanacetum coccineum]